METGAGGDPWAEDEDQAALRQLARDVAAREIAPRAAHHDETGELPRRPSPHWPPPTCSG